MSQDRFFTDNVSDKFSGDDDEEELQTNGKGLVVSGREDSERPSYFSNRYYCTNCRKGIHNTPDNDRRCKRKGCECKCQTHYVGRDGRARPYGTPDDSFTKEPVVKPSTQDDEIARLNEEWHSLHGTKSKSEPEKEIVL